MRRLLSCSRRNARMRAMRYGGNSQIRSQWSWRRNRRFSWVVLALATTLPWTLAARRDAPADLVVLNARVVTVDPSFRIASAVAIRDGVFTTIGDDSDVEPLIGPRTRVIRADGRMVIPGL